ncbi:MAG: hypothetical protein PHI34_06865 [Acidobacteriota bacterium]|nr:hypothetical protein [Acidobacteriota bacterium]
MKKLRHASPFVVSFALFAASLFVFAACQKKTPAPTAETASPKAEAALVTIDDLTAVLGKADAENSGAADVQIGQDGVLINYHYFLIKEQAFDKAFGPHIAPKIRDLYAKIKPLDRIAFDVSVADLGNELWKPRLHFAVDRKLVEETDWTKLLGTDFFQVVKDLKTFD